MSTGSGFIDPFLRESPFEGGSSEADEQNIAAQAGHRDACFALTAYYMVGVDGVLPQSDVEAYLWAKKAAEMGLAKAQYAVGYFTEVSRLLTINRGSTDGHRPESESRQMPKKPSSGTNKPPKVEINEPPSA